jgi:hypothetical protein
MDVGRDQEVMVDEQERACLIYPSSGGTVWFGTNKKDPS